MRLIEHTPKKWAEHLKLGRPIAESIVPIKGKLIGWSKMSDSWLVKYVQRFVDENDIRKRRDLIREDGGLYKALRRRKLLDRVEFKADERRWSRYSDDELVDYAQKYVEENDVRNRSGLYSSDNGLYDALRRRKLLGGMEFKADERRWRRYSDDELVDHAHKFVEENGIGSRSGLQSIDSGLYGTLIKRKLIGRVFSHLEQNQERQGMQEISDAMSEFSD